MKIAHNFNQNSQNLAWMRLKPDFTILTLSGIE